jgi:4-amino-4-deoxy-L-arabinose transferase-like glycosyltransferase
MVTSGKSVLHQPKPTPGGSKLKSIALTLLAPILLISIAFLRVPIQDAFEFDSDEGINLMKAFLYWQGFALYRDIWNDQPPLLTFIISNWFKLFSPSVFATRLLILLFAALLVWTFQKILQRFLGAIPSWIGTVFLILSWSFLKLSVAVMIGLPSLSLAMLAIYILTLYKDRPNRALLCLSGGILALSMQIKLFTVILIPLLILWLFDFKFRPSEQPQPIQKRIAIAPALLWIASLGATYLLIGLLFNSLNYDQLLASHMQESIKDEYEGSRGIRYLLSLMVHDADFFLLALLGAVVIFQKKYWNGLLPLTWLGTSFLLLLKHRPVWYHHYLLISIPAIWLAMYGVLPIVDFFKQSAHNGSTGITRLSLLKKQPLVCVSIVLLVISFAVLPAKVPANIRRPNPQWEIVDQVKAYREHTRWVFSDRPIIPFYAQLPVPPEVAVLSSKRFASGNFGYDDVLNVIKKYEPEQIVLARRTKDIKEHPGIRQLLSNNYTLTYSKAYSKRNKDAVVEHYLIKSYPQ